MQSRRCLDVGLHRLVVGSAALKQPEWFAEMADKYAGKLAAGIDARDGMVATDGWLETSQTPAIDFARDLRARTANIAAIIYTDIARDGMMQGPNFEGLATNGRRDRHPVGCQWWRDDARRCPRNWSTCKCPRRSLVDRSTTAR